MTIREFRPGDLYRISVETGVAANLHALRQDRQGLGAG